MAPKINRKPQPKRSNLKSKLATRRSKTPEQILQARRARLFQQLDKGFHQNALKTCNQLLDQQGTDNDILVDTKAKLLTILERYQETLEFISKQKVESEALKLLECYCLYKLGQLEKADKAISNPVIVAQEDLSRARLALESQIFFKLGRPQEAKAHLEELLIDSDPNHPEHLDLTANLSACQARIDFADHHIPNQIGSINIDVLESVPITSTFFNSHPNFPSSSGSRHSRSTQSAKVKPVKPLDPTRPPPDPERWLPLRQRENVNNKFGKRSNSSKNKKAKQQKLATQGSVSTVLPPSVDQSSQKTKQNQRKKKNKK
ncbi:hypothetical protein MJO28_013093 [Puccinia striiformis f. sp. tritici]|uniref:Signal recognition particle subunit SRP72 n=2 Tax=Puccinia striiformis f. sp. tritici TaxID=168172 RepID=A0A0L0VID6_9BASI|nr:hypothetical protein Pst134EA_024430 [Puccinia striiformis f. sp. tritici]KAI9614081.1 hypothetical protein KEM48_006148 [Puccinia striiformis f. sp. tritici PST-130]KNE98764.1 hypothetical protein PSTG_07951 [Puccinia striiformis f. sp. tritici PST-78]KAH9444866.1 hypothetical protein Pst134EB_025122 [Puccinia striiformis f. sp. tritici]KAH9453561.1 hypothetical protein Pst134EA_024430 [Puccinia striiformis f. sp. tritici]KAI7940808.1 hypothetical protein MJO28_013093 [Puccinia striiformis